MRARFLRMCWIWRGFRASRTLHHMKTKQIAIALAVIAAVAAGALFAYRALDADLSRGNDARGH